MTVYKFASPLQTTLKFTLEIWFDRRPFSVRCDHAAEILDSAVSGVA